MAMEAQAVDEAFREAFEKLECVRLSLHRLQRMMGEQKNDISGKVDANIPEWPRRVGDCGEEMPGASRPGDVHVSL